MDNAGENYLLAQEINKQKWQLDIEVEYTARDTPQQNSLVEVAFNTIACRAKSLMYDANVPDEFRHLLYPKAILLATLLDSLIIVNINGVDKPRYEHDGMSTPKWINDMKVFGEAGVVKLKTKISPKMDNKGKTCIFVGYPLNHADSTYLMYDPETKGIHISRDVVFLRRMYWKKKNDASKEVITVDLYEEDLNNNQETVNNPIETGESNDNNQPETPDVDLSEEPRRSGRESKPPARLIEDEEFGNSVLSKAEISYYLSMKEIGLIAQETGYVGAASTTGFENTSELRPITYEEAMSGPDKEQWKLAIRKEYDNMRKYGVFKIVPNSELKEKVTFLDSKWVMKKKSNGIFRARLTARGFKQVDGEHYDSDDVSSPTININSARVLFVIMVTMWRKGLLIDVNGAFLLGNWEDDPVTIKGLLISSIRGLVQDVQDILMSDTSF